LATTDNPTELTNIVLENNNNQNKPETDQSSQKNISKETEQSPVEMETSEAVVVIEKEQLKTKKPSKKPKKIDSDDESSSISDVNTVTADILDDNILPLFETRARRSVMRFDPSLALKKFKNKGTKKPNTFRLMVLEAIEKNASKKGIPLQSIYSYINSNYKVRDNYQYTTRRALQQCIDYGEITKTGTKYKIASKEKKSKSAKKISKSTKEIVAKKKNIER